MSADAVFWVSLGTLILVISLVFNKSNTRDNNSHLERKLNLILNHLGIDPNQGVDEQLLELLRSGQKIQAIKLYREQTGVGLKEAKDYVESL